MDESRSSLASYSVAVRKCQNILKRECCLILLNHWRNLASPQNFILKTVRNLSANVALQDNATTFKSAICGRVVVGGGGGMQGAGDRG